MDHNKFHHHHHHHLLLLWLPLVRTLRLRFLKFMVTVIDEISGEVTVVPVLVVVVVLTSRMMVSRVQ
jgi:hypothetical protein